MTFRGTEVTQQVLVGQTEVFGYRPGDSGHLGVGSEDVGGREQGAVVNQRVVPDIEGVEELSQRTVEIVIGTGSAVG